MAEEGIEIEKKTGKKKKLPLKWIISGIARWRSCPAEYSDTILLKKSSADNAKNPNCHG